MRALDRYMKANPRSQTGRSFLIAESVCGYANISPPAMHRARAFRALADAVRARKWHASVMRRKLEHRSLCWNASNNDATARAKGFSLV